MFTVKVRDAAGVESIYSAETIEVVPLVQVASSEDHPSHTNWDEAGIFLDREMDTSDPDALLYTSQHIIQFGGDHTESARQRRGGKVWVMNAHGATVATYAL